MAGLIRTEDRSGGTAFSFEDLESRGRAILERARAQGRRILSEAEQRARGIIEQRIQEGYQRGFEKGRVTGLGQIRKEAREQAFADARQRIGALVDSLTAGLAEFEHNKRRLLAVAESGLIELAIAIAKRVCKIAVGRNCDPARANARCLLEMVAHQVDLRLHVHPDEYQALRDFGEDFARRTDRLEHVEVVSDPAVARGDCVLRAGEGTIDSSIEAQLERVAEQICAQPDEPCVEDGETR